MRPYALILISALAIGLWNLPLAAQTHGDAAADPHVAGSSPSPPAEASPGTASPHATPPGSPSASPSESSPASPSALPSPSGTQTGAPTGAAEATSGAQAGDAAQHAADEDTHGGAAHGHGAAHDAEHEPTYGLLTVDGLTALWTIVVFVALLIILRAWAWKPIQEMLQKRERFITQSLDDARREREEAKRLLAAYTEKVHKAREEATAIVDEGRRDAEVVRKRVHAEAKVEADAIVDRAKKEIGLAKDSAVKELHEQAVLLGTLIAGKIIRKELSAGDHKTLVDEALAEMDRFSN